MGVVTGPVEWLERRLTLVEGYAQETAQRFPGTCWPSDAVQVMAFGVAEFVEEVAAPENMLRLVAGAREILAEHADEGARECKVCAPVDWDAEERPGRYRYPADYPCRTVRLLAQAWGWEEDAS